MSDISVIARHALTVLAGQLAVMAFGVTDTIVAGRFSADALAALSVASAVFVSVYVSLMGVLQALMPGGPTLLKAETLADMARNHLAPGLCVRFPDAPVNPGRVFGLGSAVLAQPGPLDPPGAAWVMRLTTS